MSVPAPRVIVVEDLDEPSGLGSLWGEVNASMHRAMGCVGAVTNGSVRDLDEVEPFGFHFFASHIAVSHAYVHIVEVGTPVRVGGLTVRPGDLAARRPSWRHECPARPRRPDSRGRKGGRYYGAPAHQLFPVG